MLKLDLNQFDDIEIERLVTARCSVHGDVSEVIICDPTPVVDYKLAFVHMTDPSCIARLIDAFEAIRSGTAAVIRLDPIRWMFDSDGMLARR